MQDDTTTINKSQVSLEKSAQMFKALGDETRIRILGLLRHGELCVCDLMEILQLPQSTTSRHLAYLKNSSWVVGTRRGQWMYYRYNEATFAHAAAGEIIEFIAGMNQITDDYNALRQYLQEKTSDHCGTK